jgi:hypothetical protein
MEPKWLLAAAWKRRQMVVCTGQERLLLHADRVDFDISRQRRTTTRFELQERAAGNRTSGGYCPLGSGRGRLFLIQCFGR